MQSRLVTFLAGAGVIGALLATGAGLYFWKQRKDANAAAHAGGYIPTDAVQIVAAREARWRPTSRLFGSVIAIQSINVNNELAGVITDVKFESGSIVNKGDVLLTQDVTAETADLAAAEASVQMMKAGADSVAANIEWFEYSMQRLQDMDGQVVSPSEFKNVKAQLDSERAKLVRAHAETDQARARVAQIQATIAKKTIRAPFTARAGLRNVHPGQYLAEGAQVVSLQGIDDDIYIDFAIPQEYAVLVHPGTVVMGTSSALGDEPVPIEVVAMDAVADYTTRNVRVRSKVSNKEQRLRPGMFVDVTVPVGDEQTYVVVPSTAVRRASSGDHVFVVGPPTVTPGGPAATDAPAASNMPPPLVASQRFVKLGPSIGPDVIVSEGLQAGEEIATAGSFKLHHGSLVTRQTPAAPPKPASESATTAQAKSTAGS